MKKFNEITKGSTMYVVDLYRASMMEVQVTDVQPDKDALDTNILRISYMMNGHVFNIYVEDKMSEWVSSQAFGYCANLETAERILELASNTSFG